MQLEMDTSNEQYNLVTLQGRLDIEGVGAVSTRFTAEVAAGRKPTIVDVSGVDFLGTLGMRMFADNAHTLHAHGATFVLLDPHPMVERALTHACLDAVMPIAHGMEDAVAKLGQA